MFLDTVWILCACYWQWESDWYAISYTLSPLCLVCWRCQWRIERWRLYPSSSSSSSSLPRELVMASSTSLRGTQVGWTALVFVVYTWSHVILQKMSLSVLESSQALFFFLRFLSHWYSLCFCVSLSSFFIANTHRSFLEYNDNATPCLFSYYSSLLFLLDMLPLSFPNNFPRCCPFWCIVISLTWWNLYVLLLCSSHFFLFSPHNHHLCLSQITLLSKLYLRAQIAVFLFPFCWGCVMMSPSDRCCHCCCCCAHLCISGQLMTNVLMVFIPVRFVVFH